MNTLDYILSKFDLAGKKPGRFGAIEIPNFGRNQLAELLNELDFKKGAEIGVASGVYSAVLCKANPQMKLYGVDIWEPYNGYRVYIKSQDLDGYFAEAKQKLAPYKNYTFIKAYSAEAVKKFKDDSLDFVYIDANHEFSHVVADISMWSKKVKSGGIISGHDFVRRNMPTMTHVVEAVTGYVQSYRINPWFILGNEATNQGLIRDKPRSWMWVKQ